ncbi:rCG27461 [Rattus norvegicus]|uniref:RCG27461 n=1 Tax=Rattus norvegicus TaxID=10116 RepID=A6KQP1_RAT|nr:rCG27461 [Rattus norvegicus]
MKAQCEDGTLKDYLQEIGLFWSLSAFRPKAVPQPFRPKHAQRELVSQERTHS